MILTTLLVGATIAAGVGLVKAFWTDILGWLKRAVSKVKEIISGIHYGCKVFMRKIQEGFKEISKHYSQNEVGQWEETIVTKQIDENEVPEEFRKKAAMQQQDLDITDQLELEIA